MNSKIVTVFSAVVIFVVCIIYFMLINTMIVYQKGGIKMTKEARKNLLVERIKVITEKGKTKGQHNVITKLQRKLARENY